MNFNQGWMACDNHPTKESPLRVKHRGVRNIERVVELDVIRMKIYGNTFTGAR